MADDEAFGCCEHCNLGDAWHNGPNTSRDGAPSNDHEGPCPEGCND